MKKYILFLLSLFCLTACTPQSPKQTQEIENTDETKNVENAEDTNETENTENDFEESEITDENGTTYTKSFGSYTVPTGWIESDIYSTKNKFFYVAEGTEEQEHPNNVSINMGTNRYSAEDHIQFRQAILNQLVAQLPKGTALNGSGSFTANDYVLYTFTFSFTENGTTFNATQYYIVGDYKFVMVYETAFNDNTEETDKIAKNIVDTFKWSE